MQNPGKMLAVSIVIFAFFIIHTKAQNETQNYTVEYELVYFKARGHAEVARLMFAQAGVTYEDKRIENGEWAALKPTTPTGKLPMLKIDGEKLDRHMAIARYLAREFSMYGDDNWESSNIDMLMDSINEFVLYIFEAKFGKDAATKVEALETLKVKGPVLYKLLDDTLNGNGSGWLVGDEISVVDFVSFHYVSGYSVGFAELSDELAMYNKLVEHEQRVAALPNIAAWIASRPATPF